MLSNILQIRTEDGVDGGHTGESDTEATETSEAPSLATRTLSTLTGSWGQLSQLSVGGGRSKQPQLSVLTWLVDLESNLELVGDLWVVEAVEFGMVSEAESGCQGALTWALGLKSLYVSPLAWRAAC